MIFDKSRDFSAKLPAQNPILKTALKHPFTILLLFTSQCNFHPIFKYYN